MGKTTCRSSDRGSKRSSRARGRGRDRGSRAKTLSESREMNYGITPQQPVQSTGRRHAPIDYLALNDGLEEETPPSPKKKKHATHRPKGGPSSSRIAAQKSMSSLESTQRSPLTSRVPSTTLPGILHDNSIYKNQGNNLLSQTVPLTGVPTPTELPLLANKDQSNTLPGVPSTSVDDQLLPDFVLDQDTAEKVLPTPKDNSLIETEQDLEAANVLLSLHDEVRDDTQDEEDDNAALMPIGGPGAPVDDVTPQKIQLDQQNVDAAIANWVQNELNQEDLDKNPEIRPEQDVTEKVDLPPVENASPSTIDTDLKDDDEGDSGVKKKGSLHMKGYGLKRKQSSNRSFKCSLCDTVKATVQKLNAHHRRRHGPQMCGICSRTFDLAASLMRHMYDHQKLQFKCDRCCEAFHFESELKTHKIKHRNKNAPSFQCMKSKCGKWFMRKWDLTLHLQKHDKEKHHCDYEGCTFWTNTTKHLNEHKKSHSDDHTHVCKECGKAFKYRSGLKRHRDNDHKAK